MSRQQDLGVQALQPLQRLYVVTDAARAEHAAHHPARHQGIGGKQQSLVLVEQADAGRGVARRVHHVEAEVAEIDQVSLFQPDIDIDRHIRLVEHLAQHREIITQHDLVGGQPVRGDDGAAAEMIGGADVIEMFMAENQHIDLFRRAVDMMQAFQQGRIIRGQPDVDHDGSGFSAHQIGVGGAVLETDLVDVLGRLNQRTDVIVQDHRKRARLAVAHGLAALKVTALEARNRLLSASMIISANAGCWLTRYTKRAWLIRITRVFGAAAIAVAERAEPSITAISPKNSPLPRVTISVLPAPVVLMMSILPSSTTNSSRPTEPSSKMTSDTSYSLMHFSIVMQLSVPFWPVY